VLDLGIGGKDQDGGIKQFLTDHPARRQSLSRVRGYDGSSWPRHDGLKWPHLLVVVGAGMVVSA
jgi:hypothetical protein